MVIYCNSDKMTYIGYADKEKRKQYLKEYMREYRKHHEPQKRQKERALRVYLEFKTQSKNLTDDILSSDNPLKTVKGELEEKNKRLNDLLRDQDRYEKLYMKSERNMDPKSIQLLIANQNVQKEIAKTLDCIHWLECILKLAEKQVIKEEKINVRTE